MRCHLNFSQEDSYEVYMNHIGLQAPFMALVNGVNRIHNRSSLLHTFNTILTYPTTIGFYNNRSSLLHTFNTIH
jgi:hypothetical protein